MEWWPSKNFQSYMTKYFRFSMEDIVSVTVYRDISSLTGEKRNKDDDIFDPNCVIGSPSKVEFFLFI